MSDQTRREAGEDLRILRLLQPALLQVIIVIETNAQNFRWCGHRRQQVDSLQVDPRRLPEGPADMQQVCALCDQLGQSAWKSTVWLREAVPTRTFVRGNSGDSMCFKIDDAHKMMLQPARGRFSSSSRKMNDSYGPPGRLTCGPL